SHQIVGIKPRPLPQGDQILVAESRRMSVMLEVVFVLALVFDVHIARVPVARLHRRLRAPMRPNAELRVAKPLRYLVSGKRFIGRLKRAGNNLRLRPSLRGETYAALQSGNRSRQNSNHFAPRHFHADRSFCPWESSSERPFFHEASVRAACPTRRRTDP